MPFGSHSGDASGVDLVMWTFLPSNVVLAKVVPDSAQHAPGSASPVMRSWEPSVSSTVLLSFTSCTVTSIAPSGIGASELAADRGTGTWSELVHPAASAETARVAMVS